MTTKKRGKALVTKEYIDKVVDEKTVKQLMSEMLKGTEVNIGGRVTGVNWLPLAALHSFIYCLYSVKNDKNWAENLQHENARLDAAYEKISAVLHKLEEKNILVSVGSKKWRSKSLGFTRVSIHRIVSNGKESQFLLDSGEFHEFSNMTDEQNFVHHFQACYSAMTSGLPESEDMPLAITVTTVVERLEIKASPKQGE